MTASGGDAHGRLLDIWTAWGLKPDTADSKAQQEACVAVGAWLAQGESDPAIVIRAVQILLADPERPGGAKRPSWLALRNALAATWSNVGTGEQDLFFAQALLLAAWPTGKGGWLAVAPLFESAWGPMRGRARQRPELDRWRQARSAEATAVSRAKRSEAFDAVAPLPAPGAAGLTSAAALQHVVASAPQHNQLSQIGVQLGQVLQDHHAAIERLNASVSLMPNELNAISRSLAARGNGVRAEIDLLWWGQARYCRRRGQPYRRIQNSDDVLLEAAIESSSLSEELDVEPAAAFLVETLHALGHDVFEKKPVRAWMEGLHAALSRQGDRAISLSDSLKKIATEDALGLPVTWVWLQAKQPGLVGAGEATGIALDVEIDRGEWASWVFREGLLDLRLDT